MTRLAWGSHGERFFEAGVDRGVLYLPNQPGVAWNGLKSVSENPSGGAPTPYYIDGFKYLNVATSEEFAATLEAFSSPQEFGVCDGTVSLHNGLFATQQPRQQFSLCYRTSVGNDRDGIDHAYKIHIVYNALAAPSQRNQQSHAGSTSPTALSWGITTTPPKMTGLKPTAHLVIDSRYTPPKLMQSIENILYGSDDFEPDLWSFEDIMAYFNSVGPMARRNSITTPTPWDYINSNWFGVIGLDDSPRAGWAGGVLTDTRVPMITSDTSDGVYLEGDEVTMTIRYCVTAVAGDAQFISVIPHNRTTGTFYRGAHQITRPIVVGQEEEVVFRWTVTEYIDPYDLEIAVVGSQPDGMDLAMASAGFGLEATEALIENGHTVGTYFDGDTPDTDINTYQWMDEQHNSQSIMLSWY